ncbi:hypothetical protein CC2G_012016 [Coprinopsis cinerea AmutBmut pab1-1]|nr:hypothetical protein CC2G_012016 [Coprinopsis cinerea AmutBmut pab1-1]
MPPKGSSLTQTTLSFGSSKPSAVAAKTKKAAGTTRSAGKKANTVTTIDISSSEDEEEQRNLDDIQEPQPPSDSETEDGIEQHSDEKRPDGSRVLQPTSTKAEKSTTAVSKAKPKTATHETVKAAESAVKSKVSAEKAEVESRPHLNVKDPAYSRLFAEARQKNGYLPTGKPGASNSKLFYAN